MTILEDAELRPLDNLIEPRWWTGAPATDPSRFTIDAADHRMNDGRPDLQGDLPLRMREVFADVGVVHVVNTGLTEHSDMRALAATVIDAEMSYAGGANPRERIEPNVYEVGAPLEARLHYHHEMAYLAKSTRLLGFLAKSVVPGGGQTYVSDNIAATDALLATEFGQRLRELGVCYRRDLTDRDTFAGRLNYGVYNHWQQSFGTEDPDEAVQRANERGLVSDWGPDRLLRTHYRSSAFEYYPGLDRNLLFSSIADHGMWFDTWPLVQHLPYDQRPLGLTFGDGTEFTRHELEQYVAVYDAHGTPIDWSVGDVAIVCNYRFAHGRPEIRLEPGQDRELGVMLGEQFDRVGALDDKW
ncbi:MAG: TauD/TfdA family dioxygenase [Acidimicrobiia bacterium]|nr:TauD/TfdA family dioxygenase [Acidimicrobiia bacterium]